MGVAEQIRERKLSRMRQGQAAYEIVQLFSDPEVRFAMVPLREVEYHQALDAAARVVSEDNIAGIVRRERTQNCALLSLALREPNEPEQKAFVDMDDMVSTLDVMDIDFLLERFTEMSEQSNPAIDGISDREFEQLKKVLQTIPWNELSGRSWYAAKRFLGALIQDGLLQANLLGSTYTSPSTTTSESEKSTPTA
jgi:hypothetical protein